MVISVQCSNEQKVNINVHVFFDEMLKMKIFINVIFILSELMCMKWTFACFEVCVVFLFKLSL